MQVLCSYNDVSAWFLVDFMRRWLKISDPRYKSSAPKLVSYEITSLSSILFYRQIQTQPRLFSAPQKKHMFQQKNISLPSQFFPILGKISSHEIVISGPYEALMDWF